MWMETDSGSARAPTPSPEQRRALLQQAELVRFGPAFRDLAVDNAIDVDAGNPYRLPGRGNTLELASVGSARCPAGDHPVPGGNLVFDSEVEVGEPRAQRAVEPHDALVTLDVLARR